MTDLWRQRQKKNKFSERLDKIEQLDKIDGKQRSSFLSIMEGGLPSHQVRPANKSMFKSSLYVKDKWVAPDLKGLRDIEEALERDYVCQCRKYGSAEPSSRMARFTVRLPSSPQSFKYSWQTCSTSTPRLDTALSCSSETPQPQSSSDSIYSPGPGATSSSSPMGPFPRHQNFMDGDSDAGDSNAGEDDRMTGVRFNKDRLAAWFRKLDTDGSGLVTQREFIVHLRKNKELLELFCKIAGTDKVDTRYSEASVWTRAPGILPAGETPRNLGRASVCSRKSRHSKNPRKGVSKREISKIKEILSEVDIDGSGSMEWPEFVDFFKRAGLLLEYKTRDSLNRTELCQAAEDAEAAEQKRLKDRAATAMRATIRDGQAHRDLQNLQSTILSLGGSLGDKSCLEGADEEDGEDEEDDEEEED